MSIQRGAPHRARGGPIRRTAIKPSGQQLYVNRGIGTTGFPIRFGAPPEITVLELVRGQSD